VFVCAAGIANTLFFVFFVPFVVSIFSKRERLPFLVAAVAVLGIRIIRGCFSFFVVNGYKKRYDEHYVWNGDFRRQMAWPSALVFFPGTTPRPLAWAR